METDSSSAVEDQEWEDEAILLVELKGLPNSEEPIPTCRDTCTILGIDSPEPMLQFDQYLFKGSYQDVLGTVMIFEQEKGKKLSYFCKTSKKLAMNRVLLKNKDSSSSGDVPPTEAAEPVVKSTSVELSEEIAPEAVQESNKGTVPAQTDESQVYTLGDNVSPEIIMDTT